MKTYKTLEEITNYLQSCNRKLDDIPGMCIELWEDGEITGTKCNNGELYGQRNLHCLSAGNPAQRLPLTVFPIQRSNGHACCRFDSYDSALEARESIVWPEPNETPAT